MCDVLVYRARHSEARIQQMLWKVNYFDIVFVNTVCVNGNVSLRPCKEVSKLLKFKICLYAEIKLDVGLSQP